MIKSRCPNCEALLGFDDHLAGHKVRCPRCKVTMTVLPPPGQSSRLQSPQPEGRVIHEPQASGGGAAVMETDPLAAIAEAESSEHEAHPHHHHHTLRHHHARRSNKTATLVVVIAALMVVAFGIGFLTGSAYRSFALADSGRLLPPGKTIEDFVPAPKKAATRSDAAAESTTGMAASTAPEPRAINTPGSPAPQRRAATNPRRHAIVGVGFGGYEDDGGKSRIQFWLSNSTNKVIESIAGRVQVYDASNEHLGDLELTYSDPIPKDGNGVATESWALTGPIVNAFLNDAEKLRYRFETDTVHYADGSSEVFE